MAEHPKFCVVTPVYNDWISLFRLIRELDLVADHLEIELDVLAVNDGSYESLSPAEDDLHELRAIKRVQVLDLVVNQGHQRAIAVGLSCAYLRRCYDGIVIMDSDGEDRPEDVPLLVDPIICSGADIVVAQRVKRSEGLVFAALYGVYKFVFRCLTGKKIDFGNFCAMSAKALERLIYSPGAWSHVAAAIVALKCPILRVRTRRAKRYAGQSRMSLVELIGHGLSAIAVFSTATAARILAAAGALAVLLVMGILIAVGLRLFTSLAIPGWATTVVLSLSVMLVQVLTVSGAVCLLLLYRTFSLPVVPVQAIGTLVIGDRVLWEQGQWNTASIAEMNLSSSPAP